MEAERLIGEADLVIVHNGKISKSHRNILMQRPVITMAHNYIWNVDTTLFDMGYPGLVVGQYQATLSEFAGWSIVPNPLPLWESDFRPEQKPEIVTIAYTPSGQHDSYPEGHRLYWHGKGYHATTAVLDTLARRFSIEVISVRHRQFSHAEALSAKRRAHIVIDECVTGSYHRNSLEGLACGCIVINGVQQGGAVAEVFSRCAPNSGKLPFVQATLDTLEHEISALIEAGSNALAMAGLCNRAWIENHWGFKRQWDLFWHPNVEKAIDQFHSTRAFQPPPVKTSAPTAVARNVNSKWYRLSFDGSQTNPTHTVVQASMVSREMRGPAMQNALDAVSVIVPHGGTDRLPLLAVTLANLRRCAGLAKL